MLRVETSGKPKIKCIRRKDSLSGLSRIINPVMKKCKVVKTAVEWIGKMEWIRKIDIIDIRRIREDNVINNATLSFFTDIVSIIKVQFLYHIYHII